MPESEHGEIPSDICPICYRFKNNHAPDCDYQERLDQTKKAEGITPEFEKQVASGEITFGQQLAEIEEYFQQLSVPLEAEIGNYDYIDVSEEIKKLSAENNKKIAEISNILTTCYRLVESIRGRMRTNNSSLDSLKLIKAGMIKYVFIISEYTKLLKKDKIPPSVSAQSLLNRAKNLLEELQRIK